MNRWRPRSAQRSAVSMCMLVGFAIRSDIELLPVDFLP